MKISGFISLLLVISAFVIILGLMSEESSNYYPEANINDSEWSGKYNYVSSVNTSIAPLQASFETISDENKGWFSKLTAGISAIPSAVIAVPVLLFKAIGHAGSLLSGTFTTLRIPVELIVIFTITILVWAIFKLMELYNRWQV